MVVAEDQPRESSVRTGPVCAPPSLLKVPPPGDDRPAVEDKIFSARLILPEMMGESFKEMRKKMSHSASSHSTQCNGP